MAKKKKAKMILYFAYGSNMDENQMKQRCPKSKLIAPAVLEGYRLAFGNYSVKWDGAVATILEDRRNLVDGVLYRMTKSDVQRLDIFEGYPTRYKRKVISVYLRDGKKVTAMTYMMPIKCEFPPSKKYYLQIKKAYERFNMKDFNLYKAARAVNRVFVYGTLLKGQPNHHLLEDARYIGEAVTLPEFTMFDYSGAFPAVLDGGVTSIKGEVYEVDPETLAMLDSLEGHPTFYYREKIELLDGSEAVAYLMPLINIPRRAVEIEKGDWLEYIGAKQIRQVVRKSEKVVRRKKAK